MKLYEYAAARLPVLATWTPELARRAESFVRFFDKARPECALDDMRCCTSGTGRDSPDRVLALAMA